MTAVLNAYANYGVRQRIRIKPASGIAGNFKGSAAYEKRIKWSEWKFLERNARAFLFRHGKDRYLPQSACSG